MSEHLTLSVRFNDDDMVMLQAEVATAAFKGGTEAYSTYPALEDWLARLRGLSPALGSVVRFDAGRPDGLNHIAVVLTRLDWSGHWACSVSLRLVHSDVDKESPSNDMEARLVVEPGALDRFVKELDAMVAQQTGDATLAGLAQG